MHSNKSAFICVHLRFYFSWIYDSGILPGNLDKFEKNTDDTDWTDSHGYEICAHPKPEFLFSSINSLLHHLRFYQRLQSIRRYKINLHPKLLAQVLLKLDELKEPHRRLESNEQVNVGFLGLFFSGVRAEDADGFYFEVLFEEGELLFEGGQDLVFAFHSLISVFLTS